MKPLLCAVVSLALACHICPQRTWVVDSLGRPGSHSTEIQPALDAAASGDLILVKASGGIYQSPTVRKGVRLVGVPDLGPIPFVNQGFRIVGVPRKDSLSIQHFLLDVAPLLSVTNCTGSVHLEQLDSFTLGPTQYRFESCALVTVRDFPLWGNMSNSMEIKDSTVFFESTKITASSLPGAVASPIAIRATRSHIGLLDSSVHGAGAAFDPFTCATTRAPTSAIDAVDCDIVAGPGSSIEPGKGSAFGCSTPRPAALITTGGTLWIDPRAMVDLSKGHGTATLIRDTVPSVATGPAARGTSMPLATYGRPGAIAVVFASLPNPSPIVIPGLGTAWIDPALVFPVDSGPLDATGLRTSAVPIGSALPEGLALLFQGVEATPGAFRLTFPSVTAVR